MVHSRSAISFCRWLLVFASETPRSIFPQTYQRYLVQEVWQTGISSLMRGL